MPSARLPPTMRLALGAALLVLMLPHAPAAGVAADTLPASLSTREFWSLVEQVSEPDGFFRSNSGSPDNLLSNENTVSTVAAALAGRVKPGGVYLGVGPEQNFTFIAAMRPKVAFITDIRRGNLHLHLVYKAAFEMARDRADFVGRLFSRRRPAGLTSASSAMSLMTAYLAAAPESEAGFQANLEALTDHLTKTRGLPLDGRDLEGVDYVYRHFHRFGPAIHYTSSIRGTTGSSISYAAIQSSVDRATGVGWTFLASEENFSRVKALQAENLIVPVVGDFAGPKALRAIGAWLRKHGAVVSAFYVSNVEMYLQRNGVWNAFCANVAALPLDETGLFIRPGSGRSMFSVMAYEAAPCAIAGATRMPSG
jgi:hypothetical protein